MNEYNYALHGFNTVMNQPLISGTLLLHLCIVVDSLQSVHYILILIVTTLKCVVMVDADRNEPFRTLFSILRHNLVFEVQLPQWFDCAA